MTTRPSFLFLSLLLAANSDAQLDVLTNRYNQFSHGDNTQEHQLKAAINAKTFGKLYSYYVDGAVYAQPLFVHNVATEKYGTGNVVLVATMNDKVYDFDAAQNVPPLWVRDLTDESAGVTPVPVSDITGSNDLNIVGNAGIEGTPVIDMAGQSLFLVARTKENGRYIQRLHKLDIRSGEERTPPALIEAQVPGSAKDARDGLVHFDPKIGNQRAALALVNGSVVIAWASHEDLRPYHGWIMAYDTQNLKQIGALCITPDTADGGIWQAGRGPAIDESGALYYKVGNGGWNGKRNFGNSVIKVRVDSTHLWVEDSYTPHDYAHQNSTDADLGSSSPLLLPEDGILICGNKQGALFLLDSGHLGGLSRNDAGILQQVDLRSGRVLAGASYWQGPRGARVFVWNEAGFLEGLRYAGKRLDPVVAAKGRVASHGSPGGAVTVSSDGATPGTGIVWATAGVGSADHGNTQGLMRKRCNCSGTAKLTPRATAWARS